MQSATKFTGGHSDLPPSLLRSSVGIESFEDIRADLEQALARV